ncbi:MAG: hypothetical protein DWQ07_19385 [Chloroflexi bacterium]|nr:MAG: hypothetical protein DWQ07_19385 [Chloroflexota bacterium]MBL1194245.1 hypothetical protein [Chloroflexota bacterium]NOH11538.1 hypothetical protein [Chloroflexota bacterium]
MSELDIAQEEKTIQRGERIIGGSFVFVAIRCTLQYIVLPFMLPLLGIGNTFSVVLSTFFEVLALAMITFNIIHLWHTSWRWRYIGLSVVMVTIIAIFLYTDIQYLFNL